MGAILCARGGYGSHYLLDQLDFEKLKAHPRIFVGYSDLTALLTSFADNLGHGYFSRPDGCERFGRTTGAST